MPTRRVAASPAIHRLDGVPKVAGHWIEAGSVTAMGFEGEIHEGEDGGSLAWFADHLKQAGTTWEAERDRISRIGH